MDKRTGLACLAVVVMAGSATACTAFKSTHDGRTYIGCNEDSWSINANVRFEQGRDGGYGTLYFANYNGHPTRAMSDQLGMNEAGLVFDILIVDYGPVKRRAGMPAVETSDAIRHIMRTCATVQEAEAYLRTVNTGPAVGQLFFCDAQGGYLVLEPDTLFTGNDPWFALGNWRMSTCSDPSTIPIARLQAGRQLLMNGGGTSWEGAENVLSTMTACRSKMGEGTLYSVLFDPAEKKAHLYFYHDFNQRVTFDLKQELSKGDRTLDMASLFGVRPEYDRLRNYLTPFHQRWLFWAVAGVGALALLSGIWAFALMLIWIVACIRSRRFINGLPWLPVGLASALTILLCGSLLMQESVFYFGLADATDRILPGLAWSPLVLFVCAAFVVRSAIRSPRHRTILWTIAATHGALLTGLMYWDLLIP